MDYITAYVNQTTIILLSLAIILFSGFLMTRITKRAKLPNVTGYILAGVLIGPHVLNIIPMHMVEDMGFISDIALAFIAFGVGRFFRKKAFQETGWGVIVITLLESLIAGVLITVSMRYLFHLGWRFSLLLGAIATATAAASTMVTIRQYRARGPFVNLLLQIVAFDDAFCLVVFSIATTIVSAGAGSSVAIADVLMPLLYNLLALVIGLFSGILLGKIITPHRSEDNRLILTIAILLGIAGLCAAVDVSPLLSCMLFGTTYINLTKDKALYKQLDRFTPPVLSIFFVVSGMSLDLGAFTTLGVIGIVYFVIRIVGKYAGSYLGCLVTKTSPEIRNYLGLALVPQAGVAIGLAFLGNRLLPPAEGTMLLTIILSSSVLYELIGPASAKIALVRSGSIDPERLIH